MDIESTVSFKIIRLGKDFRCKLIKEMINEGINPTYALVIYFLALHKDGVSQKDIVRFTRLKAPTISLLLKDMESDDVITRETASTDSRKTIVKLTEKGYGIFTPYIHCFKKVNKELTKGLTEEELVTFLNIIEKLDKNCKIEGEAK